MLSVLLSVLIVLSVMSLSLITMSAVTEENYTYDVVEGEAHITEYLGTGDNVTISSVLGRCPVTAIGDYAFYSCDKLTSITIAGRCNKYR